MKLKDVVIGYERKFELKKFENHTFSISATIPEIEEKELESVFDELNQRVVKKVEDLHSKIKVTTVKSRHLDK